MQPLLSRNGYLSGRDRQRAVKAFREASELEADENQGAEKPIVEGICAWVHSKGERRTFQSIAVGFELPNRSTSFGQIAATCTAIGRSNVTRWGFFLPS